MISTYITNDEWINTKPSINNTRRVDTIETNKKRENGLGRGFSVYILFDFLQPKPGRFLFTLLFTIDGLADDNVPF